MIIPDFEKLFEPYTEHGCTLEMTRKWLVKKAAQLGIPEQIADQAITETMLELADGKTFMEVCPCCNHEGEVHNAINHYMRDKMIALHEQGAKLMIDFLQESLRAAMLAHIAAENAAFTAKQMRPGRFKRLWARLWDSER
ncbi:MAG: hypothetical protein ACLQBD_26645 [Syntrophobacteraceae bacterium]